MHTLSVKKSRLNCAAEKLRALNVARRHYHRTNYCEIAVKILQHHQALAHFRPLFVDKKTTLEKLNIPYLADAIATMTIKLARANINEKLTVATAIAR